MSRFRVEFAIPSARRSGVRTSSLPPGNAPRVVLPQKIRRESRPSERFTIARRQVARQASTSHGDPACDLLRSQKIPSVAFR